MPAREIAVRLGCSVPTVYNALGEGEQVAKEVHSPNSRRPDQATARFRHEPLAGQIARMPAYDHPAVMGARTVYATTVVDEKEVKNGLKSGENAAKIGGKITKGKWKGFPVFTLTLEERATCPKSCSHWRSCYGNHMHLAERLAPNDALLWRLERELGWLDLQNRPGFAVRLHVLGDFYSVEYVDFWRRMLDKFSALHVFGFTARWQYADDPIARAVIDLAQADWNRFAIRFSNAPVPLMSTISIEHPFQCPPDAIVCPAQLGKTEACSTCGLCWNSRRRVAFLQH